MDRSVHAVGLVVLCPLLGGPRATESGRQALMDLSTLAAVLLVAAWMLAQYALQVGAGLEEPCLPLHCTGACSVRSRTCHFMMCDALHDLAVLRIARH